MEGHGQETPDTDDVDDQDEHDYCYGASRGPVRLVVTSSDDYKMTQLVSVLTVEGRRHDSSTYWNSMPK